MFSLLTIYLQKKKKKKKNIQATGAYKRKQRFSPWKSDTADRTLAPRDKS